MDDLKEILKNIKPCSRSIAKQIAFDYGMTFKWYHTTGYIKAATVHRMSFIKNGHLSYFDYIIESIFG